MKSAREYRRSLQHIIILVICRDTFYVAMERDAKSITQWKIRRININIDEQVQNKYEYLYIYI